MNIHCKYDKLIDPKDLKPHPKNRNKHAVDQIERLAKIYQYQGIRHPVIVSNLSGFIVAGHGRIEAAKKLGLTEFPVVYQDFENEEVEYAFIQSDNAIALWAELDLSAINKDIENISIDFDLENLGIKYFKLNTEEQEEMTEKLKEDMNKKFIIEVQFPDDMEMMDIHDDLVSRGYLVKIK